MSFMSFLNLIGYSPIFSFSCTLRNLLSNLAFMICVSFLPKLRKGSFRILFTSLEAASDGLLFLVYS